MTRSFIAVILLTAPALADVADRNPAQQEQQIRPDFRFVGIFGTETTVFTVELVDGNKCRVGMRLKQPRFYLYSTRQTNEYTTVFTLIEIREMCRVNDQRGARP